MSEPKHTPGPWEQRKNSSRFITFEETESTVKDCELFPHQYKNIDEYRANAKLIAAAPDLLEALNRINHTLTVHGKVDADTRLHDCVLTAIRKATS